MHIVAVNTHPCEQCQRLGFDPPWQLVAELTYTCARKGSVRTALCLSRHLAEFLAEYADGTGPLTIDRIGQFAGHRPRYRHHGAVMRDQSRAGESRMAAETVNACEEQ